MNELLDTCPICGERSLIAVATVVIEYAITNDGEADQDWSRREVDDDSSEPRSVRCESCGAAFRQFTLDERGYLVGLGAPAGDDAVLPVRRMTVAEFKDWLQQMIDEGCPVGQEDCGDVWRHIESDGLLPEGVGCVADPILGRFVFRLADGLLGSGYETGAEQETIWLFPERDAELNLFAVPEDELARGVELARQHWQELASL